MPKVSREHMWDRRNEILNACEKIYSEQGFYGVTLKAISEQISVTRPAMYTYFETKDEILLALLEREYAAWAESLSNVKDEAAALDKHALAERVADTLQDRETLLRIQNMNLYEIELNSRVECLARFKTAYGRTFALLADILRAYRTDIGDRDCEAVCLSFLSFLLGVYPFAFHTEKQLEAMRMAGVRQSEATIRSMVYECLTRLLPDKE